MYAFKKSCKIYTTIIQLLQKLSRNIDFWQVLVRRSGSGVVDNTLDYQSRDCKIKFPRFFGLSDETLNRGPFSIMILLLVGCQTRVHSLTLVCFKNLLTYITMTKKKLKKSIQSMNILRCITQMMRLWTFLSVNIIIKILYHQQNFFSDKWIKHN